MLGGAGVAALASTLGVSAASTASRSGGIESVRVYRNAIPRWRGFNLMPFFSGLSTNPDYNGQSVPGNDLNWIRDWGFDYVRLPIDYWILVDSDWRVSKRMRIEDVRKADQAGYSRLDAVIEACVSKGLHLNLNMHRCPGYCINGWEMEPYNLFKDGQAEDDFVYHWELLARRYKGIDTSRLSFNLLNEAPNPGDKMSPEDYRRVMMRAAAAIRAISPDRMIIVDGLEIGKAVVPGLMHEPFAQAVHAYEPHELSHYKAPWTPVFMDIPEPSWPTVRLDGSLFDRKRLELYFAPWGELVRQGVGVHCGETGCYLNTPHRVFLSWFEDVLDILTGYDIGWALWNFRGDFGILDSKRKDVQYVDWYGHQLDQRLLDLLKSH